MTADAVAEQKARIKARLEAEVRHCGCPGYPDGSPTLSCPH